MLVMGIDNGYGGAPKTEGCYVQLNLLNKLYQRLHDNGYVKRVFLNKKYEDGFRKFNRSLRQQLDLHQGESDFKQASDRDRSNSQPRYQSQTSGQPANSNNADGGKDRSFNFEQGPNGNQLQQHNSSKDKDGEFEDDNEYDLLKHCFPMDYPKASGEDSDNDERLN